MLAEYNDLLHEKSVAGLFELSTFKSNFLRLRIVLFKLPTKSQNYYLLLLLGELRFGKYSMYPSLYTIIN